MKIDQLLDQAPRYLVTNDHDLVLPIWGGKRSGKSTMAMQNAFWVEPDFDIDRQVAFTADQYIDLALELKPGQAIILDESVAALLSFDATKTDNKDMYRAMAIVGERNLFHQVIHVSKKRFVKAFLEDFCEFGIHVPKRGHGDLQRIVDTQNNELLFKPQTQDRFEFPKLPKKVEDQYRKHKNRFVQEHRDVAGYDEARHVDEDMMRTVPAILKRYDVPCEEAHGA